MTSPEIAAPSAAQSAVEPTRTSYHGLKFADSKRPTQGTILTTGFQFARTAAVIAAVGFSAIAAFQLALALGAPLGRAAWGGLHVRLPAGLRIASAFAVLFWAIAALVVLGRAGYQMTPLPFGFTRWGTWILVGLLPLGALMNFASRSNWERFLWGPVALILALLCLIVARGAIQVS
jgi:hypothetical protein